MDREISSGDAEAQSRLWEAIYEQIKTDLPPPGEGRGIDIGCCNRHRPRSVFEDCAGEVFFLRKIEPI